MSQAELVDIDPSIDTQTPFSDEEFTEHVGTYNAFVHLAMWFVLHVPLLLSGIYFMTIGGAIWGGAVLFAAGLAVLIYGLISTASISGK